MGKNLVEITISAEDKASSAFKDVEQSARGLGSNLGSGLVAAASVGATAIAGIGVAAVAGAAKAVGAFLPFESQMAEVFTLMPGITEAAMSDMTSQVQAFAGEFGTLPEEVVPALYQALSAGVPADNVFEFLETAQQAAIGGVTDLTTAVDGISSVVNAYGSDIVSAAEASDQMFTAVRLGKTTMEELAASMFNVTPTASGLGVSFGDVTAALASLTSQGVPTSVATTQMRQLFIELSKEGGKAAETFQELSGKTFKEFIDSGGNVADALQIMMDGAVENDVAIQDMFGSVEAGSAALALTSDGLVGFRDNIAAMGDSTGATSAAFETMADTGAFKIDQLKATFSAALLEIGGALSPLVEILIDFAQEHLPTVIGYVSNLAEAFGWLIERISWNGLADVFTVWEDGSSVFGGFLEKLGLSEEIANKVVAAINTVITSVSSFSEWLGALISLHIIPFLQAHGPQLIEILGTIAIAFGAFTIISTVVGWVTGLIGAISAFGAAITAAGSIVGGIIAILGGPLTVVIALVAGAIALLAAAWNNNWGGIQEKTAAVWAAVQPVLQTVWDWLSVQIPAALEVLRAVWVDVVWPAIQAVFTAVIGNIQDIWTAFSLLFRGDFEGLGQFLREKWTETWETIKRFITEILPAIAGELSKFWSAYVLPWLQNLLASFVGWWNSVMGEFRAIGNRVIQGLLAGMQAQAGAVRAWITSFVGDIIAAVKRLFGIASPSRVMRLIGRDVVEGFIVGVDELTGRAITAAMALGTSLADAFMATLEGIDDRVASLFDIGGKIGTFAGFFQSQTLAPLQADIDGLTQSMSDMANSLWGEGFGGDFMAMDTTAKRLELLAMLNESDNFLEQESLRQMLAMLEEREQLQAEYLRQKEREAQLAELTAQGNFLKQQMDLISFVTDNGLSASILQGLNLGANADPGRIMEAMISAYTQMIDAMANEVAVAGGNTPGSRAAGLLDKVGGGSTVINIDARRAERGAASDIRRAVEMVLRDYGIRGDIRVRTT